MQTHDPSFIRTNHIESLLVPPLLGSQESGCKTGNSSVVTKNDLGSVSFFVHNGTVMNRVPCLCFGWEPPLHDGVTEMPAGFPFETPVVHDTRGFTVCFEK